MTNVLQWSILDRFTKITNWYIIGVDLGSMRLLYLSALYTKLHTSWCHNGAILLDYLSQKNNSILLYLNINPSKTVQFDIHTPKKSGFQMFLYLEGSYFGSPLYFVNKPGCNMAQSLSTANALVCRSFFSPPIRRDVQSSASVGISPDQKFQNLGSRSPWAEQSTLRGELVQIFSSPKKKSNYK